MRILVLGRWTVDLASIGVVENGGLGSNGVQVPSLLPPERTLGTSFRGWFTKGRHLHGQSRTDLSLLGKEVGRVIELFETLGHGCR